MNTKRVTMLTQAEREAAEATGGPMDCSIPKGAKPLLVGLPDEACEAIGNALGRYRLMQAAADAALSDSERKKQAQDTREMILALIDRMENLDPTVAAMLEEKWWPSLANAELKKPFLYVWPNDPRKWLYRAAGLLEDVSKRLARGRTGPKRGHRDEFLKEVARALRGAGLNLSDARKRAAEIAGACPRIPVPDERDLRRIIGGENSRP